jgi:hypothetical protein
MFGNMIQSNIDLQPPNQEDSMPQIRATGHYDNQHGIWGRGVVLSWMHNLGYVGPLLAA